MTPTPDTKIALLNQAMVRVENDIRDLKDDVKQIRNDTERQYVTKDEFEPVKPPSHSLSSNLSNHVP